MCFKFKTYLTWHPVYITLGDAAIGDGVKRYFLSQVISRVQFGFALDFGK